MLLIFIARSVLFVSGFYKLPTILKNYKDYDPDAKNIDSNVSLIVSNHVSFWDTIIYVYKFTPAYLSKDAVKNYPLIGPICSGLKTIYFNRSSESERKMIP